MSDRVRYTAEARADLLRLYEFLLERDVPAARRALEAIRKATDMLESFPFTCRKVEPHNVYLRELVVSFGDAGYVALFEIEDEHIVNTLAVRHQREDDCDSKMRRGASAPSVIGGVKAASSALQY